MEQLTAMIRNNMGVEVTGRMYANDMNGIRYQVRRMYTRMERRELQILVTTGAGVLHYIKPLRMQAFYNISHI